MSTKTTLPYAVLIAILLLGCGQRQPAADAQASSTSTASASAATSSETSSTTVGGITLQASTVSIASLNAEVAGRYGIDPGKQGVLLLLMARDAEGNAIDTGSLRLTATASALPDSPSPLALRKFETEGLTDYIGVLEAKAPSSVQFRVTAINGSARADIATNAELPPQ